MIDAAFAIPGDLETPTGGYLYDRRVMARLPDHGVRPRVLRLAASFPFPRAADLADTAQRLGAVPASEVLVCDGLALGAIPADVLRAVTAPIVALVHHPLALETGLSEAQRQGLLASERAALAQAAHVVVTSEHTAVAVATMFGVPPERITCAEPGTDPAPRARGSAGMPVHILGVGAVVPRKGYDLLLTALAPLASRAWRVTIVGALDRAGDYVARLRAQAHDLGLSDRIVFAGALDDAALAACYDGADIAVSASWYEGFGMALTEAMARGLAVVATCGGAAAATLPDGVALKVAPGDAPALSAALALLLDDRATRARLARAAFAHAQTLTRWEDTAARVAAVIVRAAHEAPP